MTELLLRWRAGDQECLHRLLPQVEGELRRIAHRYMRMERQSHSLQTTFLGVAARMMRHIVVDHAREVRSGKRGGGTQMLPLEEGLAFSPQRPAALVALDVHPNMVIRDWGLAKAWLKRELIPKDGHAS